MPRSPRRSTAPPAGRHLPFSGPGGAAGGPAELGPPFLGGIPLDLEIRETSDAGTPVVAINPESDHAACFRAIARAVWERAEGASAGRGGPKIVVE